MPKEYRIYLEDILSCIGNIEEYSKGLSFSQFSKDQMRIDAVIRNLEIIGEAVKKLPDEFRKDYRDVEWAKISGLRDILIHEYFGVNLEIIWDVVSNKIPDLKKSVKKIMTEI
ncbi:MAG: DUF86 domain-containing protein [Candidatus Aenigmarchaeota archaeon]|nr:DUF86 domain-containing protein [Candidatus Aenigmarchaeota archaeon]